MSPKIAGDLDRWAKDPRGRLALIIALDQFPRSLWRGSPNAFAQDGKALALALEGFDNGHYDALQTPWEKSVYILPLVHCEGPDHLDRLDLAEGLAKEILVAAPDHLKSSYRVCRPAADGVSEGDRGLWPSSAPQYGPRQNLNTGRGSLHRGWQVPSSSHDPILDFLSEPLPP